MKEHGPASMTSLTNLLLLLQALSAPDYDLLSSLSPMQWALACLLVIELLFWAYARCHLWPRLNTRQQFPSPHEGNNPLTILIAIVDEVKDYYSLRRFLSGWFNGAALEEIRQGNILELFAWAAFGVHFEDLDHSQTAFVNRTVSEMEH